MTTLLAIEPRPATHRPQDAMRQNHLYVPGECGPSHAQTAWNAANTPANFYPAPVIPSHPAHDLPMIDPYAGGHDMSASNGLCIDLRGDCQQLPLWPSHVYHHTHHVPADQLTPEWSASPYGYYSHAPSVSSTTSKYDVSSVADSERSYSPEVIVHHQPSMDAVGMGDWPRNLPSQHLPSYQSLALFQPSAAPSVAATTGTIERQHLRDSSAHLESEPDDDMALRPAQDNDWERHADVAEETKPIITHAPEGVDPGCLQVAVRAKPIPDKSGPQQCPDCGRVMSTPYACTLHQKSHQCIQEKPFTCEEADCDKAFRRHTDLRRHCESVHVKSRKYVCWYCKQDFPRRDSLTRHMDHACRQNLVRRSTPTAKKRKPQLTRRRRGGARKASSSKADSVSSSRLSADPSIADDDDPNMSQQQQQQQHHTGRESDDPDDMFLRFTGRGPGDEVDEAPHWSRPSSPAPLSSSSTTAAPGLHAGDTYPYAVGGPLWRDAATRGGY